MGRADPFAGYSLVLRTIIYVLVPAFTAWQFVRLRRALHVFQLEGYKRKRFLQWCRDNRDKARFFSQLSAKKPLVMTGRAWRILLVATALTLAMILVLPGIAHITAGWPFDIGAWALMTGVAFFGAPRLLVAADLLVTPVQKVINAGYLRRARRKLREVGPVVVGVTGSFGKTSTKFAIQSLLGKPQEVLATPGSFNTPLGICRTINDLLQPSHKYFVVEMGAYGEGEIAELCRFVHPSIAVLTAIGPAHLERFGSMDAIRRTKYEIVGTLPSEGVAIMNVDDPVVRSLADATEHVKVYRYGLDTAGRPDIRARDVQVTSSGTMFVLEAGGESLKVQTRLLGRHAVGHVLAASGVAIAAGRRLAELKESIEQLHPVEHRLQIIEGTGGVTVIDDAYNSNAEGAAAALEVLDAMPGRHKVVVTPGIIELGPMQDEANQRFGERAGRVADTLIVVASVNRNAIVSGARRSDGADVVVVGSLSEAQEKLKQLLQAGDVVLFENDLPDQYEN